MTIKKLNSNDDVEPQERLVPTVLEGERDTGDGLADSLKESLAKSIATAVTDHLATADADASVALATKVPKNPQDAKDEVPHKIKHIKSLDTDAADVSNAAGAASAADAADASSFHRVGEDVSQYTGRPRMTEEDNQSLRKSVHIAKNAMRTMANARNEEYEPFRIPAKMRAELAQIDIEAEQERKREQEEQRAAVIAAGQDLPELETAAPKNEVDPFAQMHSLTPQEQDAAEKALTEQARIDAGGARFYGKYQKLMETQEQHKIENNQRVRRNLKLVFMVIICLFGYIGYKTFFVPKSDTQTSIEELKAALPLSIDSFTSMVRIDDRSDVFKIYLEVEPEAFAGLTQSQKEARVDTYGKNARLLCKNSLIHSIISSGRKVTLLLEASDRSFFREFSIDKCPADGAK